MTGDKFMPILHLRQPLFTLSVCGPLTKHRQKIQKFKDTGDLNNKYKNKLDNTYFVHDAVFADSKYLAIYENCFRQGFEK